MTAMEQYDSDKLLTSHQVGDLLQVNASSVNKWVEEGRIVAFRTPGGHRRIRVADLVTFLHNHQMPIPAKLGPIARRRLLVVDDNEKYLAGLKRALKPYAGSIEVVTADNGVEALVTIGSFKPNVVVLDVVMPEMDGMEVCRRLKAMPQTKGVQIIIASAQLTDDIEKKALAAGATRCERKPIDLPALLRDLGVPQPAHARA